MPHFARGIPLVLTALTLTSACSESTDVTLLYERANVDPTRHILPTDAYQDSRGLLADFSPEQLGLLPFLIQLAATGQTAWAPTTAIRIPFTPPDGDANLWIDLATVRDALRVYRLPKAGPATPVALGDIRYLEASGALLVRPRATWEPGRYGVAVRRGVLETHGGGAVLPSANQSLIIRDGDQSTVNDFKAVANVDADIDGRGDTLAFFVFTVREATSQMTLLKAYVDGQKPVDLAGADATIGVMVPPTQGLGIAVGGAQVLAADDAHVAGVFQQAAAKIKADQLALLAKEAALGAKQAEAVAAAAARSEAAVLGIDTSAIGTIVGGGLVTPNFISDDGPSLANLFSNGVFLARTIAAPFGPTANGADNPLSLSAAHPMRAIPYLAFFPKTAAASGTPVIIALHGLGRSKSDWLLFAATACRTGHALIAIDLFQHGDRQDKIDPKEGSFSGKLDTALLKGGIGFPDPFINPTFLARTRDKLRQSMVDTLALIRILGAADGVLPIDFNGDGQPDPAYGPIRLVAMSLGAMVALPVAAVSPAIDRVVLTSPGAHISQIVSDSPVIAKQLDPLIYMTANADQFGLLHDSPRFMLPDGPEREVFTRVSETIFAPADPVTYASALVSGELGATPRILVQFGTNDRVIPPSAHARLVQAMAAGADDDRPVVQVEPQLTDLGVPVVPAVTLPDGKKAPPPPIAVAQFPAEHGFLLGCETFYAPVDPFCDPAQTVAAQTQIALFLSLPAGP